MRRGLVAICLTLVMGLIGSARADEFERFHPDQLYRRLGAESWQAGDHATAVRYFERAARFADKPSQLALALAHWEGEGIAVNRPLAYVYADVAAERGYPDFLRVRERMWEQLTDEERARAERLGPTIVAELGDRVAKRRLEGKLRQGLSRKTGSRAGSSVSSVGTSAVDDAAKATMIAAMGSGLNNTLPFEDKRQANNRMMLLSRIMTEVGARNSANYYSNANWRPADYWRAQDAQWSELDGVVEILPLQKAD